MLELIALLLIFLGIALIIFGLIERVDYETYEVYEEHEPKTERKVKGGGVILIGPIPIVIGDPRFALIALIFAVFFIVLFLMFWVRI